MEFWLYRDSIDSDSIIRILVVTLIISYGASSVKNLNIYSGDYVTRKAAAT